MKYFLILLLLFSPLCCSAAVYTATDSNGNSTYSDTPFENSQKIEIPHAASTVTSTPENTSKTQSPTTATTDPSSPYTTFFISSPLDQATFQNQREIPIEVAIYPQLKKGDKIQLYVDGEAYGDAVSATHLETKQLTRGSHTISVAIINDSKTVIKQTKTITIFAQYAHLGTGTTGG